MATVCRPIFSEDGEEVRIVSDNERFSVEVSVFVRDDGKRVGGANMSIGNGRGNGPDFLADCALALLLADQERRRMTLAWPGVEW